MAKKRKKRVAKTGPVWHLSAEEATLATKPHYNGYACGYGAHGSTKYNRTKQKRVWKAQIQQEGAPRGSFLFRFHVGSVVELEDSLTSFR